MPKTAKKTTKTAKTAKAAKKRTVTAKKSTVYSTEHVIAKNQSPIELVKDVAAKSLHLGLGLGAYIFDGPQNIKIDSFRGNLRDNLATFVTKAINKGQKIEQNQINWLVSFEKEQRRRVREFFDARRQEIKRTEATIEGKLEEKIEEVLTSLDIPTRQDIHHLNRRLNDLSKELSRQRSAQGATPKTKKTKQTEVVVATETQPA
jgi:polyhydroxyalkanoate synthesis regulator phasin